MSYEIGSAGPRDPTAPSGADSSGAQGPGFVRRLAALFHSPREAFAPPLRHSLWIGALAILVASGLAQAWLLRDLSRAEMQRSFQASASLSEEQKDEILARMEAGYASGGRFFAQSLPSVAGMAAVTYLIPALIYLLALNFGFGARAGFRDIFIVVTFSNLVTLPKDLILVPLKLSQETLFVFLSPAALVDPDRRALITALERFDVFTLYRLVLLTLGLAAVSGLTSRKTAVPVLLLWLAVGLAGVAFWLSPIGQMFG